MLGDNLRHLQSGQSVDIVGFVNSEKRQRRYVSVMSKNVDAFLDLVSAFYNFSG